MATAYADQNAHLFLSGRDAGRLEAVAERCRTKGAEVSTCVIDVTDTDAMASWIRKTDETVPLGLVIANAGISGGTGGGGETDDQARQIFATNLDGVVNTVLPAIAAMRRRSRGQLVLMASLAGFRGMPSAPAYCSSKAAVRVWGEGLRGALAQDGIGVTVICPGFVDTPMTKVNRFPMPFLVGAEKAAVVMRDGIDANRARVSYPWPMAALLWLLAALPPAWTDCLLARMPAKGS